LESKPGIPPPLSDLIMKSLSKEPADRFQTGKEMAEVLNTCLAPEDPVEQTIQLPVDVSPKKKSMLAIVVGVAAVLLGVLFYFYLDRPEQTPVKPAVTTGPQATPIGEAETRVHSFLNITSDPSGAQVYVDGLFKGKTPLTLDFSFGKYEIKLNLADHYEWEAQIDLKEEGETPLFVRLIPMEEN